MNKIEILGVKFDKVNKKTALDRAKEFLASDRCNIIVTPNPEMVENAREHKALKQTLNEAELSIPDGIGIIYAAKILSLPLHERVPGIELMEDIISYSSNNDIKLFLLGSKPTVAELAAEKLRKKYKNLQIVGTRDGYFKEQDEITIINQINDSKADALFVALGSPKQELFMSKYKDMLNTKIAMGVGGSLDVFAGTVKRAPIGFQKLHMEWLYRALKEPKRFVRLLKIPTFLMAVKKSKKSR